jgi:hypothetical protein
VCEREREKKRERERERLLINRFSGKRVHGVQQSLGDFRGMFSEQGICILFVVHGTSFSIMRASKYSRESISKSSFSIKYPS